MGKPLEVMYYMHEDSVSTKVTIYDDGKVTCENYTDNILNRVFPRDAIHTLQELYKFFESRCFPKERANCKELLKVLGLDYYNPYDIVHKTHGVMTDDLNWLKFEGEDLDYEKAKELVHLQRDLK